jgi:hypothetical protein
VVTPELANALAGRGRALTSVSLRCPEFAPGAFAALASALAGNSALPHLCIDDCNLSRREIKAVIDALRFNRSLVSLEIPRDNFVAKESLSFWTMLQTNLTLCRLQAAVFLASCSENPDLFQDWALVPQIRQRLIENEELQLLRQNYPMAKLALSLLPLNLPQLPQEVSAYIASLLLQTDATALPSYCTLHMLASHRQIKAQHQPCFPGDLDLARHPSAQRLAQYGIRALPLTPDVMRDMARFCIRHKASDALAWLVVHASGGELNLRASEFNQGEVGWLIQWTRAAPCPIKLRLDNVSLSTEDIADIARGMSGNHALTCLSLKGCPMQERDVTLIGNALRTNTAMVALHVSEDLIPRDDSGPYAGMIQFDNGILTDGAGYLMAGPRELHTVSTDVWAQVFQRQALAFRRIAEDDLLPRHTHRYFLFSMIAFSLKRNAGLKGNVLTLADINPNKVFKEFFPFMQETAWPGDEQSNTAESVASFATGHSEAGSSSNHDKLPSL